MPGSQGLSSYLTEPRYLDCVFSPGPGLLGPFCLPSYCTHQQTRRICFWNFVLIVYGRGLLGLTGLLGAVRCGLSDWCGWVVGSRFDMLKHYGLPGVWPRQNDMNLEEGLI